MVNNSGDSDVAINNAAPVKVIKAACSNHATQGTNSARSTHVLPIIHIPIVTGIGTDGGGADDRLLLLLPGPMKKVTGVTPRNHKACANVSQGCLFKLMIAIKSS